MKNQHFRTTAGTVVLAVLASAPAFAQAPKVANAKVVERAVTGPLQPFFDSLVKGQGAAAWVGYTAPSVGGQHIGCCGDRGWSTSSGSDCGPCYLEGRPEGSGATSDTAVKLEGDANLVTLFRIEGQRVGRIAVFSPGCQLDAGGLPFIWLTGVQPADSVRLLAALARSGSAPDRVTRTAPMAIALHRDASADTALEELAAAGQSMAVRKQAVFWMGVARGEPGYRFLRAAAEREPSAELRREVTMALAQSSAPGGVDTLIQMAKADADASVRSQALFWLGQKAGRKAVGTLSEAIESDPESQVRERAVFALSQLPKDEGVPLLIQVARSNRDARVRQRAMFWLGQSKDARAVAFFEEILKGR